MRTNVSIKFNSIEEYREIEKKLEELGYVNDKGWNEYKINIITDGCVGIYDVVINENLIYLFTVFDSMHEYEIIYNNLEEFLNY